MKFQPIRTYYWPWQPCWISDWNEKQNFVEDHARNIPAKFGSNWPSGFGEKAWNVKSLQTTDRSCTMYSLLQGVVMTWSKNCFMVQSDWGFEHSWQSDNQFCIYFYIRVQNKIKWMIHVYGTESNWWLSSDKTWEGVVTNLTIT
jgi:hypothetical protein